MYAIYLFHLQHFQSKCLLMFKGSRNSTKIQGIWGIQCTPKSCLIYLRNLFFLLIENSAEFQRLFCYLRLYTGCPDSSHYGENCSTPCHLNCLDGRCDVVDGSCLGCVQGYTGYTCDTGCNKYYKKVLRGTHPLMRKIYIQYLLYHTRKKKTLIQLC